MKEILKSVRKISEAITDIQKSIHVLQTELSTIQVGALNVQAELIKSKEVDQN